MISIDPKCVFAYFNRGISLHKVGSLEESVQDYSSAISLDPQNPDFFLNRGNVLQKLERHTEAIQDYSQSLLFGASNISSILISRGLSAEQSADYPQAKQDF